ncbi:MAG: PEP-CTERM sorting domain-containing protein [Planctomycetales bacterium]|nr:PEP-CTERM sorting domain-containing protein [Planctomycetales bacterium]
MNAQRSLLWVGFCSVVMVGAATRPCAALPQIDVSNDVGGSSADITLMRNNFWAQSFTVTADGLLTQVDVQIGKYAGAERDVQFELHRLVGGAPTMNESDAILISSIPIDSIPLIESLADPPPFVSVDVSAAGIHAQPGDQYAFALIRGGTGPAVVWRSEPNSYADGSGFYRSLLNQPWTPSVEEFGFQTWVDATPTAPYKLYLEPTYDVSYRPGEVSSLVEGETALVIGGFPGYEDFPEQRPILEFPLADIPSGAVIQAAHLDLDFYVSSGAPRIEITGFAGDGLASLDDGTTIGTQLAITGPTNASSPNELPINAEFINSLRGQASHAGLRLRSLDVPEYVGFVSSDSNSTISLPPRLVIEYTLPQPGDANGDGHVDGLDYLVWASHFEQGPNDVRAVPEPITVGLLLLGSAMTMLRRRVA